MQFIMKIFGWPLGFIMLGCYMLTGNNYALAIIVFTILVKVATLPLSIKQQKEQAKMQMFQPKLEALQKKYANNRERYNEEVQKLYTEEGYNPMSGCLPSLIQFPILFGVLDVVYKPLYHILRIGTTALNELIDIANAAGHTILSSSYYSQIELFKIVKSNPEVFSEADPEIISKISGFNMDFLGLDLSVVPKLSLTYEGGFNWYLIIPLLCGVFQFAQTIYTMKKNPTQQAGGGVMKGMLYIMPLFSVYIAFIVPAGAGFYWTVSALLMLVQSVFLNIKYNPKKLAEQAEAEYEAKKEEKRKQRVEARERLKKIQGDVKDVKEEAYVPETEETLSKKEEERRKLAEARRRDAEKYGEKYVEVTDDDLK